jgi:two-component system sensor kinase FixL
MTPPFSRSIPLARLLVVDDEEGLRFLIADTLDRDGYAVAGAESGEQALEWLKENSADLLLLDLKLPDMSAPVLAQRLRQRGVEIPFIVITGHGDERTAVEVMKQGALDYVMKESSLLELLPAIVRRALSVVERERNLAEANNAIRDRERRYHSVIQTALDGFISFEATRHITEVNDAICDLLGYTREEMLQLKITDIDALFGAGEIEAAFSGLTSQGPERFSARARRRDGNLIEVEVSMRADQDNCFCFVHDVSEQRLLEREVLEISEDERRRFGRELHDGLGQQLTALEMMMHTLARRLSTEAPALTKLAEEISEHTRSAIAQSRRLAHGLAPVRLESEGLTAALNDLAYLTTKAGTPCEFECELLVHIYELAVSTHLYRIAQEAVNNAMKYAAASRIVLRLEDRGHSIELTIEDNGRGLPETPKVKMSGMGLQVMNHRARLMGGRLDINSTPGVGVRIVCLIPKQR